MKNILILCTGNSCRSQIMEGFFKANTNNDVSIFSAGVETHGVNPRAIETMKELGIDISTHTSNLINEYKNIDFDYVITVCDNARERCPYFPSRAFLFHKDFPDPAKANGTEEEITKAFRGTRDMIALYSKSFIAAYL